MAASPHKLVALLAGASAALLLACAVLVRMLLASGASRIDLDTAIATPELRESLVRELARNTVGVFDTHNDPDVGRVLRSNLNGVVNTGVPFHSNDLGLRERPFELPKPAGTLRVVLLGDSFVMGYGAEQQDRMGVFLERYLRERSTGWDGSIEVLHVGIGSWNIVTECTYVRRMLTELAPDLVVHLTVANDLDDVYGVRGFGSLAAFTPRMRARTDSTVHNWISNFVPPRDATYLLLGVDHESRSRYAEAVSEMQRLALALAEIGSRYLVAGHWGDCNSFLWRALEPHFAAEDCFFVPPSWSSDPELVFGPSDAHFRRAGHERFARVLYHVIRDRGLLPRIALSEWPETEELARDELRAAWDHALSKRPDSFWLPPKDLADSLRPATMTPQHWRQVYAGIDDQSLASPYVSVLLPARGRSGVQIRGSALDGPELRGARVLVSVEEFAAHEFELVPGEPFDVIVQIPEGAEDRTYVNVRLEASDYVYVGRHRQHCVSFRLEEIAIVRI